MEQPKLYLELTELVSHIKASPTSFFLMNMIEFDRRKPNQGSFQIDSMTEIEQLAVVVVEVETVFGIVPLLLKYVGSDETDAYFVIKNATYLGNRDVRTSMVNLLEIRNRPFQSYVTDLKEEVNILMKSKHIVKPKADIDPSLLEPIEEVEEALLDQRVCYLKIKSVYGYFDADTDRDKGRKIQYQTSWLGVIPWAIVENLYILYSPTAKALYSVEREWFNQRHSQVSWWY